MSYTVPVGKKFFLQLVEVSGENIAVYDIFKDAAQIARRRTWWTGGFNTDFSFVKTNCLGVLFSAGEKVELKVEHSRTMTADFEGRITGVLSNV